VLDSRNLVKELPSIDVLRNEVKIQLVLVELKDLNDVRVVQLFQDVYFVKEGVHILLAHVVLSNDLHCPEFAGGLVLNFFHLPIGPLSEGL
jgi:hypothetical protein